jgi:hypothetical protein
VIGVKPPLLASAPGAVSVTHATSARAHTTAGGSLRTGRCHSMKVVEQTEQRTRVPLPRDVTRPFEVYVNGVPQREGEDFELVGPHLLFRRELRSEGKLGFWRWASILIGMAGTYRQNDSVDVVYERGGRRVVASKLPLEPA